MRPAPTARCRLAAIGIACTLPATAGVVAAQEPSVELPTCAAADGATLDGRVRDRATRVPLGGATVEATVRGRTRSTRTTAAGRFRLCGIPDGAPIELRAAARAVEGDPRRVTGGNGGRPVELEVALGAPSRVLVSVTDAATGEPVDGVTLRLEPGPIGGITNEVGRAGFGLVPPGEYRLRTDHIAYAPTGDAVFIAPGRSRELHIALRRRILALDTLAVTIRGGRCGRPGTTTLSGTVVDRRTRIPIDGAVVSASRFVDRALVEERARSGEDGTFVFCGMPDDTRFRLEARLDTLRSDGVAVRTGAERGEIVLEIDHGRPAFAVLRVTDADTGMPVEGAMIRLDPFPLGGITNEDGRAGFRELPPGEYRVRVDHFAYASFDGTVRVEPRASEEYAIELRPTAIAVEPLEVRITGRDPVLIGAGFYDRMATLDEGYFYDYWDMEPYALLSTFIGFKSFMHPTPFIFVNGRPMSRLGYESVNELPFGEIRGIEHIRCADLPPDAAGLFDDFAAAEARGAPSWIDCWAMLIWLGEGRVRQRREEPTDRCANERRAELECGPAGEKGGGS